VSDEIETTEVEQVPDVPAPSDVNEPAERQAEDAMDKATEKAAKHMNIDPTATYNYEHEGQVYQVTGAQYLQMARTGANAMLEAQRRAAAEEEGGDPSSATDAEGDSETDDVADLKKHIEQLEQKIQGYQTETSAQRIQDDLAKKVQGSEVLDFVKSLPDGSDDVEQFKVQVLSDMQINRSTLEKSFAKIEKQWSKLAGKSLQSYLTTKVRDQHEALAPTGGRSAKPDKPLTAEDFHNGRSSKYLRSRIPDLFS
jgi:hypothetical protein